MPRWSASASTSTQMFVLLLLGLFAGRGMAEQPKKVDFAHEIVPLIAGT
jgi:hypothetical protein